MTRPARLLAFLVLALPIVLVPHGAAADRQEQPAGPAPTPRNVIVFIADGAGYNMLQAVRLWTGEPLAMDGEPWTKLALATYALRGGARLERDLGPLEQSPLYRYDPQRFYDTTPVEGARQVRLFGDTVEYPRGFAGYELHRRTAPDSAATATAIMSGVVTYNGAINVDGDRQPVESVPQLAKRAGKRVGVVSSVPWTHATPACAGGAHNRSRDNYSEISREILDAGHADVLAGAGHPEFHATGAPRARPSYTFYDEADWKALRAGERTTASGEPWRLVQETSAIRSLAAGPTPERLVIMPRVGWTLQQRRRPADHNGDGRLDERDAFNTAPGDDPPTPGLPTLVDLAAAGLNAVDDDPDGFFLMIEGGAVDWAMHDNQLGRAIEEYLDFDAAIRFVCDYLDAGTNGHTWQNTLVIVTADHDHMLYGPQAGTEAFQELEDRGAGRLPGYRWISNSHSNNPVPLFARGPGAERLIPLADELDSYDDGTRRFGRGPYLHQAELGRLLKQLVAAGDMLAQ